MHLSDVYLAMRDLKEGLAGIEIKTGVPSVLAPLLLGAICINRKLEIKFIFN